MPEGDGSVGVYEAIAELVRLGIVEPTWIIPPTPYGVHGDWDDDDDGVGAIDDDGQEVGDWWEPIVWWNEPFPGRDPTFRYDGFDPDRIGGGRFSENHVLLAERNESDGIRVWQARAIFANPCGNAVHEDVAAGVSHARAFGMELFVIPDNPELRWYSSDAAACVFRELHPLPYTTFKRTFRYFLLRKTAHPTAATGAARLKPGVLPDTAIQPQLQFFQILACASEDVVRLGLADETAEQAWAWLPVALYVSWDTFCLLWALYRKGRTLWQRARALFRARCLVHYWSELASRPDRYGNAPPAAIEAFRQEFH